MLILGEHYDEYFGLTEYDTLYNSDLATSAHEKAKAQTKKENELAREYYGKGFDELDDGEKEHIIYEVADEFF